MVFFMSDHFYFACSLDSGSSLLLKVQPDGTMAAERMTTTYTVAPMAFAKAGS